MRSDPHLNLVPAAEGIPLVPAMRLFRNIVKAVFLSRPNRFTLLCDLGGMETAAYLPNPGRLWEILLPGTTVYLEHSEGTRRKMPYTVVAAERYGRPVMLHTHRTNDAVQRLIEEGLVPGLEGAEVARREVTAGGSRFDFLLRQGGRRILLEVKSCTLFSRKVAMFPDAVTERGKRHVEELLNFVDERTGGMIIFLVNSPEVRFFMPEYHTDPGFAAALCAARRKVEILPLSIGWNDELELIPEVRPLPVPWDVVAKEAGDGGCYMLILALEGDEHLCIGGIGEIPFRGGYYIYVGSARRGLAKRLERHRRRRKNLRWHIDHLRTRASFHAALAVRTADDLECTLAEAVRGISDWEIPRFGSSDCSCSSHLFGMKGNPLHSPAFHNLLQRFRMDRPVDPASLPPAG